MKNEMFHVENDGAIERNTPENNTDAGIIPPKKEVVTLVHGSDRESDVEFRNKKKIGQGHYGKIYRVESSLVGDEEKLKNIRASLVVKEFRHTDDEAQIKKSLLIYDNLKKAGVRTWPTYRRIKDRDAIAMTDGEGVGAKTKLISTSDASKSKNVFLGKPVNRVENIENAVQKAVQDAILAGENGIILAADSWFANISELPEKKNFLSKFRTRDVGIEIDDIFVGDFDNIAIPHLAINDDIFSDNSVYRNNPLEAQYRNLWFLKDFIIELMRQIVTKNDGYIFTRVDAITKKAIKHINKEAREIDRKLGKSGRWDIRVASRADENDPYNGPSMFHED